MKNDEDKNREEPLDDETKSFLLLLSMTSFLCIMPAYYIGYTTLFFILIIVSISSFFMQI